MGGYMARRKSFMSMMAQAAREAERQRERELRRQTQLAKEAERAQKAYLRAIEQKARLDAKEQKALEKEQARLYVDSRVAQVALQNEQLEKEIEQLNSILSATLSIDDFLDFTKLRKIKPVFGGFVAGKLGEPERQPILDKYLPVPISGLEKLIPGAKRKYDKAVEAGYAAYEKDLATYQRRELERQNKLVAAKTEYEQRTTEATKLVEDHNAEIDQFEREFSAGEPTAIINYFTLVLEASSYPEGFPQEAKLAYVPESKQLVVEYDLPPFDAIPEIAAYKYVKAKDEVTTTARPATQRKALYSSVTAQITLRTVHELFEADRTGHLETIVFNGYVDSIDRGTGLPVRTCLVTMRTTRDVFTKINLSMVDPITCLKTLNANVSKSPAELAPVRPVVEFNMVDPRFIQETDVLSTLDTRPNLMELTPSEFESLITNLFEKMGLETRLTQASRDGGVDCVAYDPRPIFGGKVVIQAKRYKHTVGVSAVRDLYGTMQNEGASKGILVTTSGYGKAAFEFAEGKPLELLSGSNLLYLLSEHAQIEAKIEPPENWKDPVPDSSNGE
jgi:restriction system protein